MREVWEMKMRAPGEGGASGKENHPAARATSRFGHTTIDEEDDDEAAEVRAPARKPLPPEPKPEVSTPPAAPSLPYNLQACVFAYYLLPEAASLSPEGIPGAFSQNADEVMRGLWSAAADVCRRAGYPVKSAQPHPRAVFIGGTEGWVALIEMPKPAAAPEPYYVGLLPGIEGAKSVTGTGIGIFFLEPDAKDTTAGPLLTYISTAGEYGVIGRVALMPGHEFLALAASVIAGRQIESTPVNARPQSDLHDDITRKLTKG